MRNNKKGFTIVELVIVIAVIAILAAVLIPTFSSVTNSARASAAQQQAKAGLDSIIALTEGSLPDGTLFLVTNNTESANVDYSFIYSGNKLTQIKNEDIQIEKFSDTNQYAVYVTASAFAKEGASQSEIKAADDIKASVKKLLKNAINTLPGYKDNIDSVTINTAATAGKDYYTLTINALTGKTVPTDTFRVYYTTDIQETMVVFVGTDKPATTSSATPSSGT